MKLRMALALAALGNAFVALYLHLWKLGLVGTLACTSGGGCEYVQGSRYGWFLGVDVALIGAVGWTLVFLVAFVGAQPRFERESWPTRLAAALVGLAFLFTLRLKYGEFVVLRSFCPWCAVNVVVVLVSTALVWLDLKRLARERATESGAVAPAGATA
jgi:uncharacterized membrane protein